MKHKGNTRVRRNWRILLLSDESRFTLKLAAGRLRIWRQPGEGFTEACVMPIGHFGGGSLMDWGGLHNTETTNLIMIRHTLNAHVDILHPVVMPFMRRNNHVFFSKTMLGHTSLVSPWTFYRLQMLTPYPGGAVPLIWLQSNMFGTCSTDEFERISLSI